MTSYFPGIAYVICMALGLVLLKDISGHQVSPILSLLVTSIFASIFFHIFSKSKIKTVYAACWHNWRQWLMINILVGVIWLGTYYCVLWFDATTLLFLFFLSLTATHHLRQLLAEKRLDRNIINVIVPIIFIAAYIIFYQPDKAAQWGVVSGIAAGIAGSYYNTSSRSFALDTGLSANDVLAVRFYIIILISPFFITGPMLSQVGISDVLGLILVSMFTLILPLYMSQRSLMQLPIDKHTMIISATPLVAYFCQGLLMKEWSSLLLIMSSLTVVFLIISTLTLSK